MSHDGHLQPPASLPGPIPWRRRARSEARAHAPATHPKEEADTRVCPFVYCHSNTKNPSQYNVQLSSSDSSSIETDYQVLVGFFLIFFFKFSFYYQRFRVTINTSDKNIPCTGVTLLCYTPLLDDYKFFFFFKKSTMQVISLNAIYSVTLP